MKKAKQIVSLLLAMVLLLAFTACGKKGESSGGDSSGDESLAGLQQDQKPQKGDQIVVINASEGTMKVMLYPEIAPKAVENFVTRAREGYYNGLRFYEIVKG